MKINKKTIVATIVILFLAWLLLLMTALRAEAQVDPPVDPSRSLTYFDLAMRDNLKGYPAISIVTDYPYLKKGDEMAYKVEGQNERVYVLKKRFNTSKFCFELEFIKDEHLQADKLEYVRINDYRWGLTEEEKQSFASGKRISSDK